MKRVQIILLLLIAVLIGSMVAAIGDASTYADFEVAFSNEGDEYHVVGTLNRDKEPEYNPVEDPNVFTFYMFDSKGREEKVVLHKSKPQDFERSEQIVLIGEASEGAFHASEILLKCPSKYTDGEVRQKSEASH